MLVVQRVVAGGVTISYHGASNNRKKQIRSDVMRINASQHIDKPVEDIYRIICDSGYRVPEADADVVSMTRTTDAPVGAGAKWLEVLKVPGSTIDIDLWITSVDPGKSVDVEFKSKAMKGTATFSFNPSGEGTDLVLSADATTQPLLGWLMYPMIRMDFRKRETGRLALVKQMAESGELDPASAEAAPAIE